MLISRGLGTNSLVIRGFACVSVASTPPVTQARMGMSAFAQSGVRIDSGGIAERIEEEEMVLIS